MLTDFDLQVVGYTPGGERLGVIPTLTVTFTAPEGAGKLSCTVSEVVYGEIPALLELAVEVWNGDEWIEPADARFLLQGDDNNDRDVTGTQKLEALAAVPRYLANNWLARGELADLVDGKRRFNSATPGAIMATVFDEAKARGVAGGLAWAPGVTYDFTPEEDSNGVPWAEQVSIGLEPGKVNGYTILQSLVDQGVCEASTEGRVMRLFNTSTGTDRTTGGAPVRLAGNATGMPVRRSSADLLTHAHFYGDDGFYLEVENDGAATGYGRLEVAIAQGGVSEEGTAIILSNQTLAKGKEIRRQITASEPAAAAEYLPVLDYVRGDWVQGLYQGEWERLRVTEIIISRDAAGVVTIDTVLNDRFVALLARMAKRQAGISGAAVAGGSGTPSTENRSRPKPPEGLVVASTGYWSPGGAALSQVAASWEPVTQGENDVALTIDQYEFWGRPVDGETESGALTTSQESAATWSPFTPGQVWRFKARARSSAGVWGEFSDEFELTTAEPLLVPTAPDAPDLTTSNGIVQVVWSGLFDTEPPTGPTTALRQINVELSPTEDGIYAVVSTLFVGAERTLLRLAAGSSWWVRFVAIDRLGRSSDPSEPAFVTVAGIDGADIEFGTADGNILKVGTVTVDRLEPNIGDLIEIEGNVTIVGLSGRVDGVTGDVSDLAADLAAQRLRFNFNADELTIQRPGSDKSIAIDDDSIQMRDGAVVAAEWKQGVMTVPRVVVNQIVIGDQMIEPGANGMVWRNL